MLGGSTWTGIADVLYGQRCRGSCGRHVVDKGRLRLKGQRKAVLVADSDGREPIWAAIEIYNKCKFS